MRSHLKNYLILSIKANKEEKRNRSSITKRLLEKKKKKKAVLFHSLKKLKKKIFHLFPLASEVIVSTYRRRFIGQRDEAALSWKRENGS